MRIHQSVQVENDSQRQKIQVDNRISIDLNPLSQNAHSNRETCWKWNEIRAEEETIHIVRERDADIHWVSEKVFPALLPSRDPLRPAGMNPNLGIWSKSVQPLTIQTRARAAAAAAAPAKLVGDGSGVDKRTIESRLRMAPGAIGQEIPVERIRNIQIRRNDPAKRVRIPIEGEETVEIQGLEDSGIEEILGSELVELTLEEVVSYTLQVKPLAMTDGATFKFAKKMRPFQVTMNIEYQNWAGTTPRADVTVQPKASVEEVFAALQLKVDEKLDHPSLFHCVNNFGPAQPPWMNGQYRFWCGDDLA
jgi:hypothetical protein